MTIHPVPKPEPKEKRPRKRLQAKKQIARKTPVRKVNKARLDKRSRAYRKYLSSPEWRARRLAALIAADYKCQRCGNVMIVSGPRWLSEVFENAVLHVHHKTYARFTKELPEDLEVCCADCHQAEHASRAIRPRFQRAS